MKSNYMLTLIENLRDLGIFSDIDVHFAKFMATLSEKTDDNALLLGAVLASHFTALGSSCVDLNALAGQSYPQQPEPGIETLPCPSLSQWQKTLLKCRVVGQPGDYTPLVLDKHRLYLYRYWDYEQKLGAQIRARCRVQCTDVNHETLKEGLLRLFPAQEQTDGQKIAAFTAVLRHFCIISGGPGTGKTTTVVKILALLLEQNPNFSIALAAPTGKAAARLQEAITQALHDLNSAPTIKAAIPQETYTIHRLLGSQPDSPYFISHAGNLLPYDVVVIDEASMVDLALMAKLTQAIPKSARWILLGDKDQLASVETGTVLGDICEAGIVDGKQSTDIQDSIFGGSFSVSNEFSTEVFSVSNEKTSVEKLPPKIVLLNKSYRFGEDSGIWRLAQAVKQGQSEKALRILKSDNYPDVNWHHLSLSDQLPAILLDQMVTHFSRCLKEREPAKVLELFEKNIILCALRRGPYGIESINRKIEEEYRQKKLIQTNYRWYHGRPIMITRNDYRHQLFNGDIGIILRKPTGGYELQAFFPDQAGQVCTFWPNRLPEHETVYAMTIHKSQGSEFDNVLILLPDTFSPVLSRELIYTGMTRARQSVSVWGTEQVFKQTVSQKISRSSGLQEQLS
jgi:exodeoxyribonuclease V alpha subunit